MSCRIAIESEFPSFDKRDDTRVVFFKQKEHKEGFAWIAWRKKDNEVDCWRQVWNVDKGSKPIGWSFGNVNRNGI